MILKKIIHIITIILFTLSLLYVLQDRITYSENINKLNFLCHECAIEMKIYDHKFFKSFYSLSNLYNLLDESTILIKATFACKCLTAREKSDLIILKEYFDRLVKNTGYEIHENNVNKTFTIIGTFYSICYGVLLYLDNK